MIRASPGFKSNLTVEFITDPAETARYRIQREQHERNSDWLETHWADLLPQAYEKYLAVAGQEAFLADTAEAALAQAKAAHPEDRGVFVQYVLPYRGPRIYAIHW